MFRTLPLSIIRSFTLYTQQRYTSYRFADCYEQAQDGTAVLSSACSQAVSKTCMIYTLLCVQWKTSDDGQRDCPKHVQFYSKNKIDKLVHLVSFTTRIHSQYLSYCYVRFSQQGRNCLNSERTAAVWNCHQQANITRICLRRALTYLNQHQTLNKQDRIKHGQRVEESIN